MRNKKTFAIAIFCLLSIVTFWVPPVMGFDPETASRVSQSIAEWSLLNQDKNTQGTKPSVYISSSLGGILNNGISQGVCVVNGLSAFDDYNWQGNHYDLTDYNWKSYGQWNSQNQWDYNWQLTNNTNWNYKWQPNYDWQWNLQNTSLSYDDVWQQSRQWELNSGMDIRDEYISALPNIDNPQTSPVLGASSNVVSTSANGMAETYFEWAYGSAGNCVSRMYTTTSTIMGTMVGAADQFRQTLDYIGTSMQVMNPPVYLKNDPERGMYASRTSWGLEGHGSYPIKNGTAYYRETLNTSASKWNEPGNIIRTHTDDIKTDYGTYYRHVEIITPATSFAERFMMHNYPVGDYYSENSTISTTTMIRESYRTQTLNGVTTIYPTDNNLSTLGRQISQSYGSLNQYNVIYNNTSINLGTLSLPTMNTYSLPQLPPLFNWHK